MLKEEVELERKKQGKIWKGEEGMNQRVTLVREETGKEKDMED